MIGDILCIDWVLNDIGILLTSSGVKVVYWFHGRTHLFSGDTH